MARIELTNKIINVTEINDVIINMINASLMSNTLFIPVNEIYSVTQWTKETGEKIVEKTQLININVNHIISF